MRSVRHISCLLVLLSIVIFSCKREERAFRVQPPDAQSAQLPMATEFHAGPATNPAHLNNDYEQNAFAMARGKILYESFNCVGCHFHGGGGIGPPLMDDKWVYGSAPDQIFATIIQGRPNGMPSYRGRIPDYQVWQIVAYVRSLSGLANSQAAPGRDDHMQKTRPPTAAPSTQPQNSFTPKSAEMRS